MSSDLPWSSERARGGRQALLICNGAPPSRRLLRRRVREADFVIAADGGANTAYRYGIRPDVIIGDLDSIRPGVRRAFRSTEVLHVRRQDNTDLEKALDLAVARRCARVVITGATGGRIDLTLSNLSVLWLYARRMALQVVGDGWYAVPVLGAHTFTAPVGTIVSLLPCGTCSGITLRGLVYPMRNGRLTGGAVAVSNRVRRSPCRVEVRQGRLLLVVLE